MADASYICDLISRVAVSTPLSPSPSSSSSALSRRTVLVDSLPALRDMLREISTMTFYRLAVDCEGVNLDRYGKLCLLALSPSPDRVYLLDISTLGAAAFNTPAGAASGSGGVSGVGGRLTVKGLLEDARLQKALYDVRCDSDALYHQYGVRLQNVLDVQVAELAVRRHCDGQQVFVLTGLSAALDQHLTPDLALQRLLTGVSKASMSAKYKEDPRFWDRRPLCEEQLRYAADDVAYLHPLATTLLTRISSLQGAKLANRVLRFSATRALEYDTPYHELPKGRNRARAPRF